MLGNRSDLYYKPSGNFTLATLVIATIGAGLAAAVLALIYGYAIVYIPLLGYVTFILTFGFGLGVGLAATKALDLAKVRNRKMALVLVLVAVAIGYYVSWAAWLHALFNKADADVTFGDILFSPGEMWAAIKEINEIGSWSLKGWTPTGAVLWLFWGVELVIVVGTAVVVGTAGSGERPFCEACELWCHEALGLTHLGLAPDELRSTLREQVEAKNLDYLESIGPAESRSCVRVDLFYCNRCRETNMMSLSDVSVEFDSEGQANEKVEPIVTHLLLSPAEAQNLRDMAGRLEARAVDADS